MKKDLQVKQPKLRKHPLQTTLTRAAAPEATIRGLVNSSRCSCLQRNHMQRLLQLPRSVNHS